jgi:hypothetical protein
MDHLVDEARAASTAIMCAEVVPWRCHRSLIADALLVRGIDVVDIIGPGPVKPHRLRRSPTRRERRSPTRPRQMSRVFDGLLVGLRQPELV